MPKLYHFPLCPFSRIIRIAAAEYGIYEKLTFLDIAPWENSKDLFILNPAGTLPVLVEEEGEVIADIRAIMEYMDETRPEDKPSLFGEIAANRAETRRLAAWFNEIFYREVTEPYFSQKIERKITATRHSHSIADVEIIRQAADNIRSHMEYIAILIENRNWLSGDEFSYADITAAAHLSVIDYLGEVPWSSNQITKYWYARVKSRPCFRSLLTDQIKGITPPRIYPNLDF